MKEIEHVRSLHQQGRSQEKRGAMRISLFLIVLLTGCATTATMNRDLGAKWIGKPVDSFFVKNGPPVNRYPTQDGRRVYTWSKRDVAGGINLFCDLRLVADDKGILTDIGVSGSSIGAWTTSYCNEIDW